MDPPSRPPILAPPRGFRDILPTEARELRVIERTLTETFAAYGYMPLEPPMVEYAAAQPAGERLIQFLDGDGSLVALRPDLTTAVARRAQALLLRPGLPRGTGDDRGRARGGPGRRRAHWSVRKAGRRRGACAA